MAWHTSKEVGSAGVNTYRTGHLWILTIVYDGIGHLWILTVVHDPPVVILGPRSIDMIKRFTLHQSSSTSAGSCSCEVLGLSVLELEFSKASNVLPLRVFIDSTAAHAIITFTAGGVHEAQYLHTGWPKPRPLPRLRGTAVSAVAFDAAHSSNLTTGWDCRPYVHHIAS